MSESERNGDENTMTETENNKEESNGLTNKQKLTTKTTTGENEEPLKKA